MMNEIYISDEQFKYVAQTENSLVGCILVDPCKTMKLIGGMVRAEDFLTESGKAVFLSATSLIDSGKDCDVLLIQAEAKRLGLHLDDEYCRECMMLTPTIANAEGVAQLVHNEAEKRAAKEISAEIINESLTPSEGLGKLRELLSVRHGKGRSSLEAMDHFVDYVLAASEGKIKPFLKTGFRTLDAQLAGGLIKSGLITFAGRPGMGKSSLVINIAEYVAKMGKTVVYFSTEMTEEQISAKRNACLSGLSYEALMNGELDDSGWERFMKSAKELSGHPFEVRENFFTLEEIEREARCADNLGLIIVDHIGQIAINKRNRYEEVMEITHRLKRLALSLQVPVLALCQINREVEKRENKRPTMADLRDSGSIEEDSDAVCLLYRASYYQDKRNQPKPWEADPIEITVGKNRHGMTGTLMMDFFGINNRFRERELCA